MIFSFYRVLRGQACIVALFDRKCNYASLTPLFTAKSLNATFRHQKVAFKTNSGPVSDNILCKNNYLLGSDPGISGIWY